MKKIQKVVRENFDRLMLARSPGMRDVVDLIRRAAALQVNVLITGESGTGKELVARAIHECSPDLSFLAINLSELSTGLLESELFGHKRYAFTGANQERSGLIAAADGGTLFLDEIGELPPEVQVKLLRVIQHGEIRKMGSDHLEQVRCRFICATHRHLAAEVRAGRFREDLYHRLNAIRIHLPPLRERIEDIEGLVLFFVQKFSLEMGLPEVPAVSPDFLSLLSEYQWPGNVRELEYILLRALFQFASSSSGKLEASHVDLPTQLPYKQVYASLALINRKNGDDSALFAVRNIRWDNYFLPGRRLSKEPHLESNFRTNLIDSLKISLDLQHNTHYEIDEEKIRDVTMVEFSAQELVNKLYHFRLFPLHVRMKQSEFDSYIDSRSHFQWLPVHDLLDGKLDLAEKAVSPTLSKLILHLKKEEGTPEEILGSSSFVSTPQKQFKINQMQSAESGVEGLEFQIFSDSSLTEDLESLKYRYYRSLVVAAGNAHQASQEYDIGYHTLRKQLHRSASLVFLFLFEEEGKPLQALLCCDPDDDVQWGLPSATFEGKELRDFRWSLLECAVRRSGVSLRWVAEATTPFGFGEESSVWEQKWGSTEARIVCRKVRPVAWSTWLRRHNVVRSVSLDELLVQPALPIEAQSLQLLRSLAQKHME